MSLNFNVSCWPLWSQLHSVVMLTCIKHQPCYCTLLLEKRYRLFKKGFNSVNESSLECKCYILYIPRWCLGTIQRMSAWNTKCELYMTANVKMGNLCNNVVILSLPLSVWRLVHQQSADNQTELIFRAVSCQVRRSWHLCCEHPEYPALHVWPNLTHILCVLRGKPHRHVRAHAFINYTLQHKDGILDRVNYTNLWHEEHSSYQPNRTSAAIRHINVIFRSLCAVC